MIESKLLIHLGGYVDGRWRLSSSNEMIAVTDPATGEVLAQLPAMGAADTQSAIEAAERAMSAAESIDQRRHWLTETARLLLENQDELARIITREQAKPLKESKVEVEYAAGFFSFFATKVKYLEPEHFPAPIHARNWKLLHRPAGVVGLITPWNFPLAMLAKKLSAAIGAGCGVVVKPSELTPLTTIALWHLLDHIPIPRDLLNLVIGEPAAIGKELCEHPAVRLISFTGSTEVGKVLSVQAAPHLKRLALELGGNAPFIVMDDADPIAAADALMPNKFRCAGQTCVCANRILVHRKIAPEFIAAIVERVAMLRVGNGMDAATDIGPLINRAAFDKVDRHVRDAIARGAKRLLGNDPPRPAQDWGAFYPPTVLAGVNGEMLLWREETFGPVVAISAFDSDQDMLDSANGTPFGLAAYLFTRDERRAEELIARLHFGHVGINTGMGPTPEAPFGGMKQSGFGREGGIEGLLEFSETQTVVAT